MSSCRHTGSKIFLLVMVDSLPSARKTVFFLISQFRSNKVHIPVSPLPKALVCGRSLPGLWVRIPPAVWFCIVSVVCCQVEVSSTG